MVIDPDVFVWFEKYRPKRVSDCILPSKIKENLGMYLKQENLPHLLFVGPPGCGKTTAARALCDELGINHMFINASEERGIDTLRGKIIGYATTVSLTGGKKAIILDEADNLTQDAQMALRAVMEQYVDNCTFILTANYETKLIDAVLSRAVGMNFTPPKDEIPKLASQFFKRVCSILDQEGVKYDKNVVVKIVQEDFPDYRRTLNSLQRHSANDGKVIDVSALVLRSNVPLDELMGYIKDKEYTKMRSWVAGNPDIDFVKFYRKLYDSLDTYLKGPSIPVAVLIIGEHQFRAAFVADQEINLAACLTQIMLECEVK